MGETRAFRRFSRLKALQHALRLALSRQFDCEWYRYQNPDFLNLGYLRLLLRYAREGGKEQFSGTPDFDNAFYVRVYSDVALADIHPHIHYLDHGAPEGRVPMRGLGGMDYQVVRRTLAASPLFDAEWYAATYQARAPRDYLVDDFIRHAFERNPSSDFDSQWYFSQNGDVRKRDILPLLHYLRYGCDEQREPMRPEAQIQLAKDVMGAVGTPESDVRSCRDAIADLSISFTACVPHHESYRLFAHILSKIRASPRHVVLVPFLGRGGAEKVALRLAAALSPDPEHPALVLVTDRALVDCDTSPAGHATIVTIPDRFSAVARAEAIRLLVEALWPNAVININSRAGWAFSRTHGPDLADMVRLYAFAFCFDYADNGAPIDYIRTELTYSLNVLKAVITDNEAIIADMRRMFEITTRPALFCLRQPIVAACARPHVGDGADILWASRLSGQKNVELLMQIANLLTDCTFHVYGDGDPKYRAMIEARASATSNIRYHGAFETFAAIADRPYLAFLYTSRWDGLPNVLLEVAARGLPIVAPAIGGVPELVNDDTGYLVRDHDDPAAFAAALRAIRQNRPAAARKVTNMDALLVQNHSPAAYVRQVEQIFCDPT
jgi:glycosyltransferase involved in cell wall biosynthesis